MKTTQRDLDDPQQTYPPTVSYFNGDGQAEKRTRNLGSTTPPEVTNYYIRSTLLNKVISETDGTGRKLKTYVPANGATLAEQIVSYHSGTTETLYFIHQDASATGAQQTKANGDLLQTTYRTGEYDALGRNIADPGPYITLNEEPPGTNYDGTNFDLFGSGQGYRPGQVIYAVDGQVVPASYFFNIIESGAVGGMLGLLETMTRMSVRDYSVRVQGENGRMYERFYSTAGEAAAVARSFGQDTIYRNILVNDSWSVITLINPVPPQQTKTPDRQLTPEEARELRTQLENALAARRKCRDFLNATLRNLRSDFDDIMDVFDAFAQGGNIYDAPSIGATGEARFGAKSPRAKLRLGMSALRSSNELEITALHELVHGSARTRGYTHERMAEAMYAAAKSVGIELDNAPYRGDPRKLNSKKPFEALDEQALVDIAASKVWKEAEEKACGGK